MELYAAVHRAVFTDGFSQRAAARRFGLSRVMVVKMMHLSLPPTDFEQIHHNQKSKKEENPLLPLSA